MHRQSVDASKFNTDISLPYELRISDFQSAMQDVYDFFFDINENLVGRGLQRLDEMLRPAAMSGIISDMVTATLAQHSRSLVENQYHNGHPDLIVKGVYENDSTKSGAEGVEIKTTRNKGGAVDTHGARDQWMCVFVYRVDNKTEPAIARHPMKFTKVFLGQVVEADFRWNNRNALGTNTATLHKDGIRKLRKSWVYLDN